MRSRDLPGIHEQMLALLSSADPEKAHILADALLIEAIEFLAEYVSYDTAESARGIVEAFEALQKWYS